MTGEQAEIRLGDSTAPSVPCSCDERSARAALAAAVEPGAVLIARGVGKIGPQDMVAVLRRGAPGTIDKDRRVQRRLRYVDGSRILEETGRVGARFVCPGDPEWPERFIRMAATLEVGADPVPPPFGIWLRGSGDVPVLTGRAVAIVGARAATSYGRSVASELAADLSAAGWTVVSGGAYGIDGAAHRGSLAAGRPTIAVLACGIDVAYPRGHTELLERITADGLLMSERPPAAAPSRPGFLKRNRLIAGLTTGTIVVEAARRSGALSTAQWAGTLQRPVGIVPGPVTSALSAGCHKLARDGATVVTNAQEIVDLVGCYGTDAAPDTREPDDVLDGLTGDERDVYEAMPGSGTTTVDELCRSTGMTARQCLASLASLTEAGLVVSAAHGWMIDHAR